MKKIIKLWIVLLVTLLVSACQKDLTLGGADIIAPDAAQTITLEQAGETKLVDVASLGSEWQVNKSSYPSWLSVEKKGQLLEITATANDNADERRTNIELNTSAGIHRLDVTQFGTAPFIAVDGSNGTAIFNHEAHVGVELNVVSNSDNWSVEQVDKEKNNWLTFEIDQKQRKLKLTLAEIDRKSEWAQSSRSEKLFLSNGNKHYLLNVTQNGFVQFQLPVWDLENFNLEKVIALEGARNNARDRAFEIDSLLPYKQDSEKIYYAFHSPGEQAPHIFYQPYWQNKLITTAWVKAPKGQTFKQESFDSWLRQQNFKLGNKQQNDTETEYYQEEADRTRLVHVYNDPENFQMYGGIYKSACMKYVESSNSLIMGTNGKLSSFPMFPSERLHNKAFKLNEIIAFEKARGMKPDFYNQFNSENVTTETQDPLCKYAKLLFVPENSSSEAGSLAYVIYHFNWQGVTEDDIDSGLLPDAELSGTVGLCQVFYIGSDVFYNVQVDGIPGVWETFEYNLPTSTRRALEEKGYKLFREDSSGFMTFFRGETDLIDLRPQETRTVVSYYKSKHYVDLIKKNLNL